jgi:SAM-dependent methyltransferase
VSGALSFGAAADRYERGRPGYPDAALDWLLPAGARTVADVGAGTGKLTRSLAARGLDVVAVEPSPGMRLQFAGALPGVRLLEGTAEALPLGDASVNVVLMAQAWHWVDPAVAAPEIGRVLSSGGRLALVWNVRDSRVDWVARLDALLRAAGASGEQYLDPIVGAPFGPLERRQVGWRHLLDVDGLVDLVASRSYLIVLPAHERAEVLAEVRRLATTHPELAGRASFEIPYLTRCYRAELPG